MRETVFVARVTSPPTPDYICPCLVKQRPSMREVTAFNGT